MSNKFVAILADTHFGCRSDSQVFLDQHRKFFEEVFFPTLQEKQIYRIIHLGDFFDKPRMINVKTLNQVNDFFISKLTNRLMHIIPGNHDIYFKDSLSLTTIDEILGTNNNVQIMNPGETVLYNKKKIGFVPWIPQGETPEPFPECDILCGHFDIVGFEMYKGMKNTDHGISDLDFAKNYEMILSGHYHHPSTIANIHYIGAPIEMNWNDYGGPRGFQILNTETLELTFVKFPHKTFRKIVYDDTNKTLETMLSGDFGVFQDCCIKVKIRKCNDRYILSRFIKTIEEANPFSMTVIEEEGETELIDTIDTSQDTRSIIRDYIDQIELSVDKDRLKKYIDSLYVEAERVASLSQTV